MTDKELEKIAEDYAGRINLKDVADNTRATFEQAYKDGFKAGAEYGYNKAKEINKNLLLKLALAEADLKKANEWHYPSKGEYPKDVRKVLVYLPCKTIMLANCYNKDNWKDSVDDNIAEPIAWQYLPEPPKGGNT